MSSELKARIAAFLARPVPKSLAYIRGSFAESLLTSYAERGGIDLDAETAELIDLCVRDSLATASAMPQSSLEAATYLRESAELLAAVASEAEQHGAGS